tara:strand:- start:607 stop:942 length:336 start_codon:yes stop_codon:yes gene_type:complete
MKAERHGLWRRRGGYVRPTTAEEHSDGSVSFTTHQDLEPTLDQNKLMLNEYGDKLTPGKQTHGHRVASIPFNIWEKWMLETGGAIQKDNKLLAKYLNDPDNKYFRTTPTRV